MSESWMTAMEWAEAIALPLGEGWRAEVWPYTAGGHPHAATLLGPDSEELALKTPRYSSQIHAGKLQIRGRLPDGLPTPYDWDEGPREINVAETKGPTRVAREIASRLLPAYRTYLKAARARKAAEDESQARMNSVLAAVERALGARRLEYREFSATFGNYSNGGDIRVTSSSVELELRFPHRMGVTVAEAIAQVRQSQPES